MKNYKTVVCFVCETEHYLEEVKENIKEGVYNCPNCKTKTKINKDEK
jgi:NAD-dependent SIR2 family protein deacetylase